ncbi:hypothetical protein HTVC041P_gp39 [Pelagibacter phage HTVC041P]|uniref:DUF7483 domain-containing protein n=1 Tax=Pelagibacter phage HTVC041P TaxID=3072833 RepID=A0AAX4G2T6_9CAUD|nr:hypothetical protein HTVC041P_gp39 [Pelagibacter phage HTVC041P]
MAYTTINKSTAHFDTKLYSGNGGTQTITGLGFQPDMTWVKSRNTTDGHTLQDAVRGFGSTTKLSPYDTSGENNANGGSYGNYGYQSASTSDGFTMVAGSNPGQNNKSGNNYVAWNWKANGSGSANTDGATASTVSVNNTAGFSIVKWTGTSGNTTVGHGMNTAPVFTIVKNYGSNGMNWIVYHKDISPDYAVKLNTTDAQSNSNNYWQSTAPTNSVLTFTGNTASNANGYNMIAYCFAEKTGYSKIGSYKGNQNADGTFVYTGFKPAFALSKDITSAGENWFIHDNKRNTFNPTNTYLRPNTTNGDGTAHHYDFYSNGFKNKYAGGSLNSSGRTYIYMAFAEAPLVGSNNVPCTAR